MDRLRSGVPEAELGRRQDGRAESTRRASYGEVGERRVDPCRSSSSCRETVGDAGGVVPWPSQSDVRRGRSQRKPCWRDTEGSPFKDDDARYPESWALSTLRASPRLVGARGGQRGYGRLAIRVDSVVISGSREGIEVGKLEPARFALQRFGGEGAVRSDSGAWRHAERRRWSLAYDRGNRSRRGPASEPTCRRSSLEACSRNHGLEVVDG